MLDGREGFTLVALPNRRALACGGRIAFEKDAQYKATCELYDAVANTWTPVASMTATRAFHGGTLLNDGRVIVGGGLGDEERDVLKSVEIYSAVTNKWISVASMGTPRVALDFVTLPSGKVVAGPGWVREQQTEIYDPVTNAWAELTPVPVWNYGCGCAVMTTGVILFSGGVDDDYRSTATAQTLTLPAELSSDYRCVHDACEVVPEGEGVSKEECEKSCGEPPVNAYDCVGGRCVASAGGVPKDTCERICRPAAAHAAFRAE